MRHGRRLRKLSKPTDQRMAMLKSIAKELLKHGSIKVTEARGKEVRAIIDGVVELAKRGDLPARRRALSQIQDPAVVKKIFDEAKTRYSGRSGGYVRLTKIGFRKGDATTMVKLELV